jgi:hypothetical protein
MAEQPKRRNRRLVVLGIILLVAAAGCAVIAVFGFVKMFKELPAPLLMPGTQSIQVAAPGPQMIAYESQSVVGGQAIVSPQPTPSIQVTVVGPNEQPIAVRDSTGYTYNVGSRVGAALFEFTADQPGRYEITATALGPGGDQPFVLAVGPHRFWPMFAQIFSGMCGTFVFAVAGVVVLIVALVRHLRGRREPAPTPGT